MICNNFYYNAVFIHEIRRAFENGDPRAEVAKVLTDRCGCKGYFNSYTYCPNCGRIIWENGSNSGDCDDFSISAPNSWNPKMCDECMDMIPRNPELRSWVQNMIDFRISEYHERVVKPMIEILSEKMASREGR